MEEIELENMTVAVIASVNKMLAKHFAQPAEVNMIKHWIEDEVVIQIKQRIFGKHILHKVISYPADWKEAFKERWYPVWAKDKWPIRYTKETFDVRELVPSLNIPGYKSIINVEAT